MSPAYFRITGRVQRGGPIRNCPRRTGWTVDGPGRQDHCERLTEATDAAKISEMSVLRQFRRRVSDTLYRLGPARYYQPAYANIAASIGLQRGAMLDVGCGPGWLCLHVGAGNVDIDAIGIDSSPRMVAEALRNKGGRLNISFREMNAEDIKFPDETFDVVTAVQTAHHWAEPTVILNEVFRVLKPGGRCFLYEANRDGTSVPDGWVYRRFGWPPSSIVVSGWRRFGMNEVEWAELSTLVKSMAFSNMVFDQHGFYRRMVLTK